MTITLGLPAEVKPRTADAKRESAARQAAVIAHIAHILLPTAAYLTYTPSDRYPFGIEILTVRDSDRELLLTQAASADLPRFDPVTCDQIAALLALAESYDGSYMPGLGADSPDWHEQGVYRLDLLAALADVERYGA